MLKKEEIQVGDLVCYGRFVYQIKKINKETITAINIDGIKVIIRFDDIVFKISNEEAKRICLSQCSDMVAFLTNDLQRLRNIACDLGNLADYIMFDTDKIEDNINRVIEKINKALEGENGKERI